jgi:hypothetical protein
MSTRAVSQAQPQTLRPLFVWKVEGLWQHVTCFPQAKNAKTTVCEVSSMPIPDNVTAFAMKVRLHNNQELNRSRRRTQGQTTEQVLQ